MNMVYSKIEYTKMGYFITMVDTLTKSERSKRMTLVRSEGNKSTEEHIKGLLLKNNIAGWVQHPVKIVGRPDFYFSRQKLAVFVDGCFWHSCPICKRRKPSVNAKFWVNKIETNRKRDNRQRRKLRETGSHVMRIWEHETKQNFWLNRLKRMLRRTSQ